MMASLEPSGDHEGALSSPVASFETFVIPVPSALIAYTSDHFCVPSAV